MAFKTLTYFGAITVLVVSVSTAPQLIPGKEFAVKDFTGPMTEEIVNSLKDVEVLIMSRCNITDYPSYVFARMPHLKKLFIDHVQFKILHDNVYTDAHQLEEIVFHNNDVPKLSLQLLRDTTFKKITIYDQKQVEIVPRNFANETKRLEFFQCSNCEINVVEDGAFSNLDKLETLDLHKNHIKSLPKQVFAPLKNLKTLDLSENSIEDFGKDDLTNLINLETLNLSNNPLKQLSLSNISETNPNLKTVYIKNTNLSQSQIDDLKKNTNVQFEH